MSLRAEVCVVSPFRNCAENLALEESLLDRQAMGGAALLLYVNCPALVIGRNQNPWMECNVAQARRESVPICRRFSGGGTVYHDGGNLNYSLILPRADYDQAAVFAGVLQAVARLGVKAEIQRKTNLYAGGSKFSGTAFCFRRNAVAHHGTILVRSDLDRLRELLRPSIEDPIGRSIPSVPATVANLGDLVPALGVDDVSRALREEFCPGVESRDAQEVLPPDWQERMGRYASWAHTFADTPEFEWTLKTGRHAIRFEVAAGQVSRATLDDSRVLDAFTRHPFDSDRLARVIANIPQMGGALAISSVLAEALAEHPF